MADKKDEREESSLHHLNNSWGKIAGVFSALAVVSTALVNLFEWEYHIVFAILGGSGLILLIVGLMMDRSAKRQIAHDKLQDAEVDEVKKALAEIKDLQLEMRRDLLRIQFNQALWHSSDDVDTIMKIANVYFTPPISGDWVMTSAFVKWAKDHDVEIPPQIQHCINNSHKEN